jgi:shikimate kinase
VTRRRWKCPVRVRRLACRFVGVEDDYPGSGHIVMLGEMGVGKTTIGRSLADRIGRPFLDSDEIIESESGHSGAEIAELDGVERLHQRELETLASMIESPDPAVIAPASSVVDTDRGRELLGHATNVWLTASNDVVAERQEHGSHRRAVTAEERAELRRRRRPYLERLATIEVDTSGGTPVELAEIIEAALSVAGSIVVGGDMEDPETDDLS